MRALLAAAVLTAGACCLDLAPDDACVVRRPPEAPYCYPIRRDETVCPFGDPAPPLSQDYRTCIGELHEGEDCEDLGFTKDCERGYLVLPGAGC